MHEWIQDTSADKRRHSQYTTAHADTMLSSLLLLFWIGNGPPLRPRHVPWPQQQPEYGCPSSAFGLARLHLRTAPPRLTKAPSSSRRGMIASEPLRANPPPRALRSSSVMCGASPVSCAGRIPCLASRLLRELPVRGFIREHGVKLRWIDILT